MSRSWPDDALPFGVIISGFAINTLFYAGVLWVMFAVPFALRRRLRRRRGHCPACAYPTGQSPVCTECGAALDQNRARGGQEAAGIAGCPYQYG